mgnify:CR=1 FL=1
MKKKTIYSILIAINEDREYEIELSDMNLKDMASLIYFFQLAAAYSALLLNVNPFDQPGVEVYKKEVRDSLNG